VAALTILSQADTELSLQQHLDLAPGLLTYDSGVSEVEPEPLMMAQPVPHQSTDRRRVKVYELRNNDWFDRGTGFCTAAFVPVRNTTTSTCAHNMALSSVPFFTPSRLT
jgi:protein phosphatase-4 regulatory subunit 3